LVPRRALAAFAEVLAEAEAFVEVAVDSVADSKIEEAFVVGSVVEIEVDSGVAIEVGMEVEVVAELATNPTASVAVPHKERLLDPEEDAGAAVALVVGMADVTNRMDPVVVVDASMIDETAQVVAAIASLLEEEEEEGTETETAKAHQMVTKSDPTKAEDTKETEADAGTEGVSRLGQPRAAHSRISQVTCTGLLPRMLFTPVTCLTSSRCYPHG